MDAEDLPVDDSCQGQKVENLTARFPHRGISVLGLALFVESVDLGDLSGLVVSPYKGNAVWVSIGGKNENAGRSSEKGAGGRKRGKWGGGFILVWERERERLLCF
jgi:hypothetical protein